MTTATAEPTTGNQVDPSTTSSDAYSHPYSPEQASQLFADDLPDPKSLGELYAFALRAREFGKELMEWAIEPLGPVNGKMLNSEKVGIASANCYDVIGHCDDYMKEVVWSLLRLQPDHFWPTQEQFDSDHKPYLIYREGGWQFTLSGKRSTPMSQWSPERDWHWLVSNTVLTVTGDPSA